MNHLISLALSSLSLADPPPADVAASNPIVLALLGKPGNPGVVLLAYYTLNGAILLRCLQDIYEWIITGHAEHGRNAINMMAGGFLLLKAPEVVSFATGINIPKIF